MKEKLQNFFRAGFSALDIISPEGQRVEGEVAAAAEAAGFDFYTWKCTTGLFKIKPAKGKKPAETVAMMSEEEVKDPPVPPHYYILNKFDAMVREASKSETQSKAVVLLHDYHMFLTNPDPVLFRRIKDSLLLAKMCSHTLVIVGCQLVMPPELEKEITVVEFKLPDREQINVVLEAICASAKMELNGNREQIIDACCGGTTTEIENWLALAVIESGGKDIDPKVVEREKATALKKSGMLEVINTDLTFDDVGGLDALKAWIKRRANAFGKEAADYHLPTPKGVCLFGIQGCGKSYATKAIANVLKMPLIKMDAGKLFAGLVGKSEENVRAVIAQVEAFGKCVLQIEELDKSFAGMKNSHDGDSGTTRRVIGTFLTWMQEKTSPVFIVATANDLTKLPPELLRKGRWDELFFLDLPTESERAEIWKVQIRRHHRAPKEFDLSALAKITDGWSGAEIEALFNEALYAAFDEGREPDTELLLELSKDTAPLSKMMAADIEALRTWSTGKARRASRPQVITVKPPTGRKLS